MPERCYDPTGRLVKCPPGRGEEEAPDVTGPAQRHEAELTGGGTIEKVGPASVQREGRLAEEEARERQRKFLESELERARQGQLALRERAGAITETGLRTIREGARLRRGQAESSLAAAGGGRSALGERARRAGREATTMAEEQFQSKVLIEQFDQEFKAEQAAIDRLFQSGQAELAFLRQIRLIDRQAHWQIELAKLEQGNQAWEAFGGFISDFFGPVVEKAGEAFAAFVL